MPSSGKKKGGSSEAKSAYDEIKIHSPEILDDLDALEVKEKLRLKRWDFKLKAAIAGIFLTLTIIGLAVFIVLGSETGTYKAAEIWWMSLGPFVGFLLRGIYDRKESRKGYR
jgi:hypothetical protein